MNNQNYQGQTSESQDPQSIYIFNPIRQHSKNNRSTQLILSQFK